VDELEAVVGVGGPGRVERVAADARHQDDPAGEADDLDGGGGHAQAGDPSSAAAAGQAAQQDPGRSELGPR
jgi:hypothetical protein